MPDTISKTNNFLKAIEKYAEEQRSKMRLEAEDFKAKELENAEEQGLKEAYDLIQKNMADINNRIASEQSAAESAGKKLIFERRRTIENEVFQKAEQKLLDFTQTEDYASLLVQSAGNIGRVLRAEDVVLYLRETDMKYKPKLKEAFGNGCTFAVSDAIHIGGIIGASKSMGLIADETLDTKLQQQREWFYEHSGLSVTGL